MFDSRPDRSPKADVSDRDLPFHATEAAWKIFERYNVADRADSAKKVQARNLTLIIHRESMQVTQALESLLNTLDRIHAFTVFLNRNEEQYTLLAESCKEAKTALGKVKAGRAGL